MAVDDSFNFFKNTNCSSLSRSLSYVEVVSDPISEEGR